MGWDDIDFTTIVVGAVTVDVNSDQNFYDVLNMFGIALDEKVNVVTTSQDALPTLPDIRFAVAGEIRADITFMEKYRALLDGYFGIWNDFDWYSQAALLDPLNFGDYLLSDDDLEFVMGENAFDLLTNRSSKNRVQLWSADLLNGLYELYKLTQVTLKTLSRLRFFTSTMYNHPMFFWGELDVGRSVSLAGDDGPPNTYNIAKAEYLANQIASLITGGTGNTTKAKICFYGQRVLGGGTDWSVGGSSSDAITVIMKSLDLQGNNISMDIVGTGADVIENYAQTDIGPVRTFTTPEAGFPFVGPVDPDIAVELAPNSTSLDPVLGLKHEYFLYGNPAAPVLPTYIDPSYTPFGEGTFKLEFILAIHDEFLMDVNNSALEFFIAP